MARKINLVSDLDNPQLQIGELLLPSVYDAVPDSTSEYPHAKAGMNLGSRNADLLLFLNKGQSRVFALASAQLGVSKKYLLSAVAKLGMESCYRELEILAKAQDSSVTSESEVLSKLLAKCELLGIALSQEQLEALKG